MSWPMVRLGDVGELIRGSGIRRSETVPSGMPCLRYGEIYTSFEFILDRPRSFVEQKTFDSCPHIETGDVVFSLTGENKEEIAKALAYIGKDPIAAGGDLAIWKKHGCDAKYLAYLMYSPAMLKAKADASNGHIIVHASVKKLQDIQFPLPPLDEQRRIVEKLEKELKRVDEMKAKFEQMEAAAEQYFKSALAEAFENVEGERVKLGDVCENCDSQRIPITKSNRRAGAFPYYGASGVVDYVEHYIFDGNFLLVSEDGANLLARSTPIAFSVSGKIWVNNHAHVLRFESMDTQRYVECFLAATDISDRVTGAAQPKLTQNALNEILLPCPSLDVQRKVVKTLDAAKSKSDRMVAVAIHGIEACTKMRKALLAEAFA